MRATSEMDSPCWRSSSSSISIEISRSRVPRRRTSDTEGSVSRSSRRFSAAIRRSSSERVEEETEIVSTSTVSFLSATFGGRALAGGKFSMLSTAFLTLASTASASAKVSISTSIRAWPSEEVLTTRSTPSSPTTLSSTRRLMSSSTSLGEEPGEARVTTIVRKSTSGICRTCVLSPARTPPRIRKIISSLGGDGVSDEICNQSVLHDGPRLWRVFGVSGPDGGIRSIATKAPRRRPPPALPGRPANCPQPPPPRHRTPRRSSPRRCARACRVSASSRRRP